MLPSIGLVTASTLWLDGANKGTKCGSEEVEQNKEKNENWYIQIVEEKYIQSIETFQAYLPLAHHGSMFTAFLL